MSNTSGVTYAEKPAYIDRMIEVGSHHFFKSFGYFNFAAAEAENGENIGISGETGGHADRALWHLRKTIELYEALVASITLLPVSDRAKKVLQDFDVDGFQNDLAQSNNLLINPKEWDLFVQSVKRVDPVGTIGDFVTRVKSIEKPLADIARDLSSGVMSPQELHGCLTRYLEALLFGQYVAEFNRHTRDQ